MKARKPRKRPLTRDYQALEVFRHTLPAYRQQETYQFLFIRWDIVKALYLIQKDGRETHLLHVAQTAKVFGFDKEAAQVGEQEGKPVFDSGLFYVNLETVMSEQVDLDRPVILAQAQLGNKPTPQTMLIDGLHRLYKAARLGRETLPCYVLSPEEEQQCRI